MVTEAMFLRAKIRKKDGKQHRYFSVVENRRVGQNKTAQRTVLYLGEINDNQEAVWRQTLEVFDEHQQQYTTAAFQTLLGLGTSRRSTEYEQIRGARDLNPNLLGLAEATR